MARGIIILGSTGSIGTQTLQVIEQFPGKFKVVGLSTNSNIDLLEKQARKFNPSVIAVRNEEKAREVKSRLRDLPIKILAGEDGLNELSTYPGAELVVVAVVGFSGLQPTYRALEKGKTIALANKETLVAGGGLIMKKAREKGAVILPVDSEHSALFQCLHAGNAGEVKKILLTASGGPFLGLSKEELAFVNASQALKHPNWKMGAKVTIDSATLMNKGFEVIEARWLFDLDYDQIGVVVHPESIVHSMVHFVDGSIIAQMSLPSMLFPIQYALSYPKRWENNFPHLQWEEKSTLSFLPPDKENFPCLELAYYAGRKGGTMPAVLNAANELAVESFLKGEISFLHIPCLLEEVMNKHKLIPSPGLSDIIDADRWAREETLAVLPKIKKEIRK
ncbi:MAG: 1-deoxy-D-xylulose-5-phosphate reductoisomerase [Firmicutes bacterium]|nr:1-deoxy-D-xylulose-5-phosphate reductoisomerase [Bacillota bacterium]